MSPVECAVLATCPTQSRKSITRTKLSVALALACGLVSVDSAVAASAAWNVDSAGNYSTGTNWNPAAAPGAAGSGTTSADIATFNRSTITAGRLVNLDASYNLGGITFNNDNTATAAYQIGGATFGGASTGTLTLSANGQIQITGAGSNNSTHGIDVNTVLSGNASIVNNFGNSILHFGNSAGSSANTVTTGTDLGNIDLVLGGSSTGSNLMSMRLNQASGTTLRLVKEGAGFWQLNGKDTGTQGLSGGLLVRQGTVSIGRSSTLSIGTGTIALGDGSTAAGNITLLTGSGVTLSNNINVPASAATNVIIERQATGGDSIYQGTITLGRDLVLRQASTGTARNLNIASNSVLTGTGNVIINTTLASATGVVTLGGGSGAGLGSINMNGKVINQSSTGAAGVNATGKILSNVTEVVQNSATSSMTLSNANNAYDKTTVSAGTLLVSSTGKLGTGDISVAGSGAILTLQSGSAIADTANLTFQDLAAINLSFTGTDTLGALANSTSNTYIPIGTYTATQLNSFFGGSVFSGTGSLQITAVPEPTSLSMLAIGAMGLVRRRRVS